MVRNKMEKNEARVWWSMLYKLKGPVAPVRVKVKDTESRGETSSLSQAGYRWSQQTASASAADHSHCGTHPTPVVTFAGSHQTNNFTIETNMDPKEISKYSRPHHLSPPHLSYTQTLLRKWQGRGQA
jgi:hypothetical protein